MKKLIIAPLLAALLVAAPAARSSGIPVVDGVHIGETVVQYLKMIEQYQNMVDRYELMKQQFEEIRGITDIGTLLGQILRDSRSDIFPAAAPSTAYSEPEFSVSELFTVKSKAKTSYEKRADFVYSSIEGINDMYSQVRTRNDTLANLKDEISSAITHKEILDLTARINAENGLLYNDMALIELYKISLDFSEKSIQLNDDARTIHDLKDPSQVGS